MRKRTKIPSQYYVTYERDGKFEAIPIMLRPLLAMNEQLAYVHHVCQRLTEALKRLPSLYLNDANVKRVIAITPAVGWRMGPPAERL